MSNFLSTAWNGVKQAFGGLYQVSRGLETVAMHTWREPTTQSYPEKMPEIPPHFRGRLALTVNPETGENLCISCRQCERVCPDKCIEITAHKSTETNKLELIDFKIDHGLCMFCGLCAEVCPTYCIINTNDFEMADYSRSSLIYDLKKLTLTQEESAYYFEAKEMPLPKAKPVKAAAPAAGAAKPAGEATGAVVGAAKAAGEAAAVAPSATASIAVTTATKPAEPVAAKSPAPEAKPLETTATESEKTASEAKDEAKDKSEEEPKEKPTEKPEA